MLLFSNYVQPEMRYMLGFLLISVVFVFIVYNTLIIVMYSSRLLILVLQRQFYKSKRIAMRSDVSKVLSYI